MAERPPRKPESPPPTAPSQAATPGPPPGGRPPAPAPRLKAPPPRPAVAGSGEVGIAVAATPDASGVITARRAGGLRDLGLDVDPDRVGVKAALQHLAKAINIAFQTDYGENYLESVYQAAIVRNGEIQVVHREYFGFGEGWFSQFGMLLRSLGLSLQGPDPASPEGQRRIVEAGPSTIRGLFNLVGRKLNLVAEFEDRVPAYVEQMFDRLEASGIILGWDRDDWRIGTTRVGLNIRIAPRQKAPGT